MILFWLSYTSFWFDFFLEDRAEILTKISLFYGRFDDTKRIFQKLTDL
jgi:hypothetical protein